MVDELARLPDGAYALGLSGGADSTALLLAVLDARPDLRVHVVHLDHQLRGRDSQQDAEFVRALAHRFKLGCTMALRSDVEASMSALPSNPSARYRAARLALYRQVVQRERLAGVVLGHHADDQAETVLLRLLRGSGTGGLGGMAEHTLVNGLNIFRPLLNCRKADLVEFLVSRNEPWREDASNASCDYARNRVRQVLARHPALCDDLLALAKACRQVQSWLAQATPQLPCPFSADALQKLPSIMGRHCALEWLVGRGMPPGRSSAKAADRLRTMACDTATPARQDFPGSLTVIRRQGKIFTDS